MKTYDFVHLVLYAADGKIEGSTKLQKIVYFAGVLTKREGELGYRPHFYGPYSAEVASAVDKLRALGFLHQRVAGGGAIDNRGFEIARCDYELTEDGKLIAEEKTKDFHRTWKRVKAAVNRLNKSEPFDYVKLSIAAKTYFLHGKLKGTMSVSELERLSARFGWKVTRDEIREAFEWLKSIHLVEDSRS
jgi:uncharacterized protein YwgA